MSSFTNITELSSETRPNNTIYINPRFRNAHINPNFLLRKQPPSHATQPFNIHVNPLFLSSLPTPPAPPQIPIQPPPKASIISQTNRKLVRQPVVQTLIATSSEKSTSAADALVKIGKRKLVRVGQTSIRLPLSNSYASEKSKSAIKVFNKAAYKIDRRNKMRLSIKKPYLYGSNNQLNESLKSTQVVVTDRRLLRIGKTPQKAWRKIHADSAPSKMLNINGVLYKTSSTKLCRHPIQPKANSKPNPATSPSANRSLTIRGTKFFVDQSGSRLRRILISSAAQPPSTTMHRIDVGGMTYVEVAPNTFQRTDSHRTRVHLNTAIQKSINVLARNRSKNNVPCAIYRRLGKCIALERGRCPKVHDPQRVTICPKFVKGCCLLDDCLLSHNVTLSKMPTCKFFLAKMCVRPNCPYLHKKVNAKVSICEQFVSGFCPAAEKCSKRHEFLCPEFESKGECDRPRCKLPHKAKSTLKPALKVTKSNENVGTHFLGVSDSDDTVSCDRYFDEKDASKSSRKLKRRLIAQLETPPASNHSEQVIPSRPKLGVLPSFISIESDSPLHN